MSERFGFGGASARLLLVSVLLIQSACSGNKATTGIVNNRLTPCPDSPNCVSSDATDDAHHVEPYRLRAGPEETWHELRTVVLAQKRVKLITFEESYLHAEFRSAVFRFVDDAEFQLRASDGIIAVRSASRVGYSDFGVNRERVENIREALRARSLIE